MQSLNQIVAEIIEELTHIARDPSKMTEGEEGFPLPRLIGAGGGGTIKVSKKIDELIDIVAQRMMDERTELKLKYTQKDWRSDTRAAFGPPLAEIDLDQDPKDNAVTVMASVKSTLSANVSDLPMREHVFGCTLFSDTKVAPSEIGPVRFEARFDWLARTHASELISKATLRRIRTVWAGKKVGTRKPSLDSHNERGIIDAIGDAPYVCIVCTSGLAAEAGREKALTAARLAFVAIALTWKKPAGALNGFNLGFDRVTHIRRTLTVIPTSKRILAGGQRSHLPHGPWLPNGKWDEIVANYSDHLSVVGECLAFILSADGIVRRPKLMSVLAHALLWFHEGCRDPGSLIAVVKFSACLDALAGGTGEHEIRRLIGARLGIVDNAPLWEDGPTLKQSIKQIYGEGRSRTIHGNNIRLGHDWTDTKGVAEQLGRNCLVSCIGWASNNGDCDDPKQMKLPTINPAAAH